MTQVDTIRQQYLDFFRKRGHAVIPSARLVPENDPTTLFTGSGMQPMVPYLLGQPHPKGKRIADSQKAFRSQDIEEVGDNRHTTFFEMLGNWSLGDYFKKEQLRWFFEFLTTEIGLQPDRLFVTVFSGNTDLGIEKDSESVEIWKELFKEKGIVATAVDDAELHGMQGGRIFFYDEKKNWWSRAGLPANMPVGEPGGPDSEVFYDFGEGLQLHQNSMFKNEPCHVNCDCGRFLEIGNSVFMQYQKQADGSFTELPQRNVDFGGGLERIAAAHNEDPDVFKIDVFAPLLRKLEDLSGTKYADSESIRRSFRVIIDHVRAAVMLAADGVFPSNKEQGYFARRLLRRAIRYGKMVGIEQLFLAELVPVVADMYRTEYPDVEQKKEVITQAFALEEQKFVKALEKGLKELEKLDSQKLTVERAFELYETYGFPLELTQELAAEKNISLNPKNGFEEAFQKLRDEHSERSRTASVGMFKGGLQDAGEATVKYHTATHLLHAALRKVLGPSVQQKGSNITKDRLRFDFSYDSALTDHQKDEVMRLVTSWIEADLPVHKEVMAKTDALASGAVAFFVEKYPDEVTVYTIGSDPATDWVSKELCGGPHVSRTGEIGTLSLVKEQAVAAGVRRVYVQ